MSLQVLALQMNKEKYHRLRIISNKNDKRVKVIYTNKVQAQVVSNRVGTILIVMLKARLRSMKKLLVYMKKPLQKKDY